MYRSAFFKWAALALCAAGGSFVNADTWSSLDKTKDAPVSTLATSNVVPSGANTITSIASAQTVNPQNKGLSNAASQILFTDIEMLKQEIQSLRSIVETQGYELNKLKTEQKQRYLDLDRRMTQVLNTKGQQAPDVLSIGEAQAQYDIAFTLMKERKLDDAAAQFTSFLQAFPKSNLAVNGYYWLGQIYYNQGNLDEARKAFTMVVNQYPDHQKAPDSIYKLGVVLHRLGDIIKSKTLLTTVVKKHSDTASARFASKYLKEHF